MNMGTFSQLSRKFSSALSLALTRSENRDFQAHLERLGDPASDASVAQISQCQPGERVEVVGTVKVLSIRAHDSSPALEIELADPTGSINVVWLGRRRIPGIVAGRTMKVCGRLTVHTAKPTIFNPRYELRPMSS
jgi:RecG-like helicase